MSDTPNDPTPAPAVDGDVDGDDKLAPPPATATPQPEPEPASGETDGDVTPETPGGADDQQASPAQETGEAADGPDSGE